jgi:DNA-binding phage protein
MVELLKEAIRADKRSMCKISYSAQISPTQLSRFLKGQRGLNIKTIERLVDALGLTWTLRAK